MQAVGVPGFLQDEGLRLPLFGEKNGARKAPCATAMFLIRKHPGHPFLLVSTDPAHSLAACFFAPLRLKICPFVRLPHRRA